MTATPGKPASRVFPTDPAGLRSMGDSYRFDEWHVGLAAFRFLVRGTMHDIRLRFCQRQRPVAKEVCGVTAAAGIGSRNRGAFKPGLSMAAT